MKFIRNEITEWPADATKTAEAQFLYGRTLRSNSARQSVDSGLEDDEDDKNNLINQQISNDVSMDPSLADGEQPKLLEFYTELEGASNSAALLGEDDNSASSIVRCSISLIFDHQRSDLERKVNAVNQYTLQCLPSHLGGIELLDNGGIH